MKIEVLCEGQMTIREIRSIIEADVVGSADDETVVLRACACDLLSTVLRCVTGERTILLTNLTHRQTVRVAEMVDAVAVCFMRGRRPGSDMVNLARESGIALLSTALTSYEASGRLYSRGLPGCSHE